MGQDGDTVGENVIIFLIIILIYLFDTDTRPCQLFYFLGESLPSRTHIFIEDALYNLLPVSQEEVLGPVAARRDCRVQSSCGESQDIFLLPDVRI